MSEEKVISNMKRTDFSLTFQVLTIAKMRQIASKNFKNVSRVIPRALTLCCDPRLRCCPVIFLRTVRQQ